MTSTPLCSLSRQVLLGRKSMGYSDQPEDTTSPSTFSYHFRLFLLNLRSIEIYSLFGLANCQEHLFPSLLRGLFVCEKFLRSLGPSAPWRPSYTFSQRSSAILSLCDPTSPTLTSLSKCQMTNVWTNTTMKMFSGLRSLIQPLLLVFAPAAMSD